MHSSQYIEGVKNTLYYCRRNNAATYGCRRLKPGANLREKSFRRNDLRRRLHGKRRVPSFQRVHPVFMPWRIQAPQIQAHLRFLSGLHRFIYRPRRRSGCSDSAAICDQQPGLAPSTHTGVSGGGVSGR